MVKDKGDNKKPVKARTSPKAAAPRKAKGKPASSPAADEIVAATLIAAAAALRDPAKARQIAASVGEEMAAIAKQANDKGAAVWKLAMDVAKRSIDALGAKPAKKTGERKKAAKKKKKKRSKKD